MNAAFAFQKPKLQVHGRRATATAESIAAALRSTGARRAVGMVLATRATPTANSPPTPKRRQKAVTANRQKPDVKALSPVNTE